MWPFASKEDVRKEVQQSQQTLIAEFQQVRSLPTSPLQVQPDRNMYGKLDHLERQIQGLRSLLEQISPVNITGEAKDVHERLKIHTRVIAHELNALELEHETWLKEQNERVYVTRQTIESAQHHLSQVAHHLLPEPSDPITQV